MMTNRKKREKKKSSKDRIWSMVPDALLGWLKLKSGVKANKTGYTATIVADSWGGAVMK